MGITSEDLVLIQLPNTPADLTVVTVNCPDKTGLGCDICRIILEVGLRINRADFSTDGRWCYMVFWVAPYSSSVRVDWDSLKNRLYYASPSCLGPYFFGNKSNGPSSPSSLYLLKIFCLDRKGLLHDVTKVLTQLEFSIQRVKVMTTPDARVVDLFLITDCLELLHTKERQDDTCRYLVDVFKENCISCDLQVAGPEYESLQAFSSIPQTVAEELFSSELFEMESCDEPQGGAEKLEKATITVDNQLSPAHTLLQIECVDQKGLFYDILRTSKECNIWVAYGRLSQSKKRYRNLDLIIQQTNGKKIVDPKQLDILCTRLKQEMVHPLRVIIVSRGPDTELLVANPVELSGKGRPRVFYDVTSALKKSEICIFSAEIGRHSTEEREWEVYRFLLDESHEFPLSSHEARRRVVKRVWKTLMGW
ncbi:ACT domain-containing protein ACR9 [Linum perenne]